MSASTSPLPYTGNKSCIVNTILTVMPKHNVYIEPCMGSAEVFFRKPKAEREILNDYNGDLVNLFRTIQSNKKLVFLLGRLYLSINSELVFRQNKERLRNIPNVLDDVLDTSLIISRLKWSEVEAAAAFFENQVYSFSSTGQTFGIARREMKVSAAVAERGRDYYMENNVRYIEGSEAYEVEFEYCNGQISNLTCSCFCSYNCKHEFATMLQLRETLELIEKHYADLHKRTDYFAAVLKGTLFSIAVDGKETGSFTLGSNPQ